MLCTQLQGVRDPVYRAADGPHCVYTAGPTNGKCDMRVRCEFKGCFWRRWHMLDPGKFSPKVAVAIDPLLL